jgi:phosphatidylglycerophosphatase C
MNPTVRHPEPQRGQVVAFDFDGTLTCRDSFVAFLIWRAGFVGFAAGLARLAPDFIAYGATRDRGALKAALVRCFLGGVSRTSLEEDARRFSVMAFDALIRPDALRCWRDWQTQDVRVIIVTASPEILVAPFARALGAEILIGTRLALDARDCLTGALEGPNCRGVEKIVRLRARLGDDVKLKAAYGDTAGDREMLAIAENPGFKVFTARP